MNQKIVKQYAKKQNLTINEAEAEIVRIIQNVARMLAPVYRFGYHGVEDIEQQGILYALEVLENEAYDVNRPLENFLSIHIRNRLSNYRRKHYMRIEPPCKCCNPFDPPASPCQKWTDWALRNTIKQNLMQPLDMSNISDEHEVNMYDLPVVEDESVVNELRSLIDKELSIEIRRDYLQIVDGVSIPKSRRDKVRGAIIQILKDRGYFYDEAC